MNRARRAIGAVCVILSTSASPALADVKTVCVENYKAGYIKKIWLNDPRFSGDHFIGIEVDYPSAPGGLKTKFYTTEGWGTILSAPGKILMQLANSAYVSQSKVFVMVDGSDCEEDEDKKPWVPRMTGLVLTNKAND